MRSMCRIVEAAVGVIVDAICAGSAASLASGKRSGIAKRALDGPVAIGLRGVAGDQQVDRKHHGYPAMALHHLPFEHHAWLAALFDRPAPLGTAGGMGENLSCSGLLEADVRIGARFRLGNALIEVTQPRQPCATIEQHLQRKGVVKTMVAAARSGWFYRVIEPGAARAGDRLEQVEAGASEWSVERAFRCVYGKPGGSEAELRELAALPRVSDRLVRDIGKRIAL